MFARELHEEEKNVYKHHTIPTDMPIERKKPQITLLTRTAFSSAAPYKLCKALLTKAHQNSATSLQVQPTPNPYTLEGNHHLHQPQVQTKHVV